jgi:hypothetical protein
MQRRRKDHPSTAEGPRDDITAGKVRCFEDKERGKRPLATAHKRRRRAEQERERQKEFRQWFAIVPMAKRSRFSITEIAGEVAPVVIQNNGQFGPDSQVWWELIEKLATDMVRGYFDYRGGIVVLRTAAPPLSGVDFKTAWDAAIDLDTGKPYRAFLEACFITREALAAWLREQPEQYPWPANWGDEPAPAPQPQEARGAPDDVAATPQNKGGRPHSDQKEEFMREAASELGIIDQTKFTTLDELMPEMKKAVRAAHESQDKLHRFPTYPELRKHMAQWCDEKWRSDDAPSETAIKNWSRELRQLYEG